MAKQTTSRPGRDGERKPVTIDLAAEEVMRDPGETGGAQPSEPVAESAPLSAVAEAGAGPKADAAEPAAGAGTAFSDQQDPRGEMPVDEPTIPSAFATRADAASHADQEEVRPAVADAAHSPRTSFGALLAAALIGGAIALAGALLLGRAGFLVPEEERPDLAPEIASLRGDISTLRASVEAPDDDDVTLAPLREQIGALEQAIGEMRSQAPAGDESAAALGEVQARLAELEQRAGEAGAGSGADVEALRGELGALSEQLQSLAGAVPVDLSGVEAGIAELRQQTTQLSQRVADAADAERVAAIETALQELRGEIASLEELRNQTAAVEAALKEMRAPVEQAALLGPAVVADALAASLESGRPFASELDALRTVGLDPEAIAGLAPHAEAGLPTLAELQSGFEAAAASITLGTPIPEGAGTFDRLLTSARGLVEVRPADPVEGGDPAAVISRIRAALAAGDIDTALSEWSALPQDARAATADWAAQAEARRDADALVARLRSDALSRLGTEG